MSRHPSISDFPPAIQEQIRRKLAATAVPHAASPAVPGSSDSGMEGRRGVSGPQARSGAASRPRLAGSKGPNQNEQRFLRTHLLPLYCHGQQIVYEGVTFKLPGGSRYTPDYTVFDTEEGFAIVCYEVKGGYRLGSEGRAYTAFRECRAAYPHIRFEWWKWNPKHKVYEREHD